MRNSKKQLFTVSIVFTFLFYILANGYRFFHSMHAGDSLYMVYQNDGGWEIALGRFVQPFLVLLRGAITAPFLISVLSLLWIGLSVYFVADFLEVKHNFSVALIAAVMSCNITILALNATFISYLDFYVLALFFSVFGVWLIKKGKPASLILGSLSLSISLGIYQSYICVSIALVLIHFLTKMPEMPTFKSTFTRAVRYLLSFLAAGIVYYAAWRTIQAVFGIWTADSYNGMASIGDYSEVGMGSILASTYRNVLHHFIYPDTFITNSFRGITMGLLWEQLVRLCNIAVFLMILFSLIKINLVGKTNLWQKTAQLLIIVLFPFGINFVCFASKGMEHPLMIYAFYFVYILAVKLTEDFFPDSGSGVFGKSPLPTNRKDKNLLWMIVPAAVLVLSWSNIVFSNQVYLKGELQENAAQSIMTRIVYRIETMEDYIPGVTPVAFAGNFESSPCLSDMGPFEEIEVYGMGRTVMTYPGTDHAFLAYVLNLNINLTQVNSQDEAILQMPVYPAQGSIAFVDGTLVVKVSE